MPRAIEARGWKREPPPIVATVGGARVSDMASETVRSKCVAAPPFDRL